MLIRHALLLMLVQIGLQARPNVSFEVPLEPPLHLILDVSGNVKDYHPIWLNQSPDVQHRDEDTRPAGKNKGDEVGCEGVELAEVSRL